MTASAPERFRRPYRFYFWSLLAVVTLVRLALAGTIGLGVDESHYVMYARRLAWGYLDHPPLVAWLTALGTLPGENPFYYRLLPILCNFFSIALLRRLALQLWGDERIAFGALVVFTLLPYQHLLMVALLPDAGLNLFWCATLVFFWQAITGGSWRAWAASGLMLGGALLAKYHAVLLPLCLGGYLLSSAAHRHWLKRIQPYAAALIALAVFSPNLIWNAQNGWISYRFQLLRTGSNSFEIGHVLTAVGGQFAAWSPLLFGLLIAAFAVIVRRRPKQEGELFVFWTSLPLFAFFMGIGFLGKVLPHWTSPGWWSGSLVLAAVTLGKMSAGGAPAARWQRTAVAGALIALLMTAALYSALYRPLVKPVYRRLRSASLVIEDRFPGVKPLPPYQSEYEIANALFGWQEAAAALKRVLESMPRPQKTFVFCHRFYTTSQLAVYLPADTAVTTLGRKIDQYRLWFKPVSYLGWDAVFVDVGRRRQGPGRYLPLFEGVDPNPQVSWVKRGDDGIREIRLYRYFGYRGGYQR